MDEHEKHEEQVEDLDTPESEAEEVKGGFSWGLNQTGIKGELGASKIGVKGELGGIKQLRGAQGFDGNTNQHNEILVAL
jgi:hypothetical protein